jgi:glyoxylase-like metal-dependent hydrolase (beta-lactamase superfamily II)
MPTALSIYTAGKKQDIWKSNKEELFISSTIAYQTLSFEKISDGIYMIDTNALGQKKTVSVYLIKDRKTALVDCGYASSYLNVIHAIDELGLSVEEIDYIIPTHVHLDHGGATGHLAGLMKNARIIAHERAVPHLINPERLVASATQVFGSEIVQQYGIPLPVDKERITAVGEEMSLELGTNSLLILHAPGHAPHQVSVTVQGRGILITADSVGIVYPDVKTMIPTTPPPSFDPDILASTIDKLSQNTPELLLVPHFGIRSDSDQVFETTKKKVRDWVDRVRTMRKDGINIEKMQEVMEKIVMDEASVHELPVYAKLSIRTSILGILHYIEKHG